MGNMPFATPLLWAAVRGFDAMAEFLLDANAEVDRRSPLKYGRDHPTALSLAVDHERPAMAKLFLARGADPATLLVPLLQDVCRWLGLPHRGNKGALIHRVKAWQELQ